MPKEVKVAKVQNFQDGDMKEIVVGDTKIVLARVKGKFYAMHGECTHYGGPLAEGALNGPRVVCPWHQAAFDITNGELQEPPALDVPKCFTTRVEGDDVTLRFLKNWKPEVCRPWRNETRLWMGGPLLFWALVQPAMPPQKPSGRMALKVGF